MNAKHTPTPWRVLDNAIISKELNGFGNCIVLEMPSRTGHVVDLETLTEEQANAAFIVRAINAHDALVEALERCTNILARVSPVGEMSPDVRQARAALKLAKKGD